MYHSASSVFMTNIMPSGMKTKKLSHQKVTKWPIFFLFFLSSGNHTPGIWCNSLAWQAHLQNHLSTCEDSDCSHQLILSASLRSFLFVSIKHKNNGYKSKWFVCLGTERMYMTWPWQVWGENDTEIFETFNPPNGQSSRRRSGRSQQPCLL